jgi:dienelactone hydrolase
VPVPFFNRLRGPRREFPVENAVMARALAVAVCLIAMSTVARAEVVTRPVPYSAGSASFEGTLSYDSAVTGKRPGIILAHELGAQSPAAKARSTQLVKLGYAVFTADFYGKGIAVRDMADAASKAGMTGKDRKVLRARMEAALAAFTKQAQVDPKQIAGVGYGVGGSALLELARSGADLEGVACVHGALACVDAADAKKISAAVLVILGSEDPHIPQVQIAAFEDEMRGGGVDWQILRLGGVGHDFTNPQAGRNLKSGAAYDADADQRAHAAIRSFLAESVPVKALAAQKSAQPKKDAAPKGVPDKALKVLAYVDEHGEPMNGYEGGRTFGNFEKLLPQTDDKGRRIRYREWDVNALKAGVNRGVERLITGSDGTAWYTDDHYKTFKKIR